MPLPQFPEKHDLPAVLNGADMIAYRRSVNKFPKDAAPRGVLICLEVSLPRRMRRQYPYRNAGRFVGDLLLLKEGGGTVGVMVNFGVGAPVVVAMAEELAAWGVREFALLSWAGGLQPDLEEARKVVIVDALRDEGVSQHYLPDGKTCAADVALTDRLRATLDKRGLAHRAGRSWTTAAPYRETAAEVRHYQKEGVLAVEMEAAGLFAFGQARGAATAAAVVLGDSLLGGRWQPPRRVGLIHKSLDALYAAMLETLLSS
ncbi:MAG: nucleoside phosphorylase [Chloroflexi bacterium]|nr:nucleoside phosphorylase [Chloroflexota bacterium]